MDSALELAADLPLLYLTALGPPWTLDYLTGVVAFGVVCLFAGVAVASFRADAKALLFLIPFGVSELTVACAGLLEGSMSDQALLALVLVLLVANAAIILALMRPLGSARAETLLLGLHSLAYGALASFMATEYIVRL